MKSQSGISLKEWSVLYEAAIAFKQLRCWEWMYDCDLFGVQNPRTGEVGYCSVMGTLGEVLALNVYRGTQGLDSYWHMHEQAELAEQGSELNNLELLLGQVCVMASFEDRSDLEPEDLGIIRKLGLKFRGRQEWPMFRSYLPGFLPWFISPSELELLHLSLQQAVEVATRFRKKPDLLEPPDEEKDQYFVRVFERGVWKNKWKEPARVSEPHRILVFDEFQLARLRKANFPQNGVWITDCVILPIPIRGEERPYYPYGFPILSAEGLAIGVELFQPDKVEEELPNKFMDHLLKVRTLPESLFVGSERARELLYPIANALNFPIHKVDDLPVLNEFLEGIGENFGGRQ